MSFFGDIGNGIGSVFGGIGKGIGSIISPFFGGLAGNPNIPSLPPLNPVNPSANPYFQAMASRAKSFTPVSGLSTVSPESSSGYTERDYSGDLPGFATMRNQTAQALNSQAGQARDNLNRQFAALGGGPSGAQVKATQNLEQTNQDNMTKAMNNIGFAEEQQRQGLQEAEHQRAFQAQEGMLGRNLQRQGMNTGIGEFNANLGFQNQMAPFDMNSKLAGLDLGAQEMNNQLLEDQFNAQMEGYKAQHSGGLLGGGGFLGTGLGA